MQDNLTKSLFKRNFGILKNSFFAFLVPALITELAAALNEFVDGILVSNLLDAKALSVVNLGSGVYYFFLTVYFLIGGGGATLYAVLIGNHEKEKADKVFSAAMLLSGIVSVSLLVLGIIFVNPISDFIAGDSGLNKELSLYLRNMFLCAVPLIMTITYAFFLAPSGHPVLTAVVNLLSNLINLVFDYIYIRIFGMGVEGASLATFTGFSIGLLILIIAHFKGKNMPRLILSCDFFKSIKEIFSTGASPSAVFVGYALKIVICNLIVSKYLGTDGIVAFTICMQLAAISMVCFYGVFDALSPFLGVLYGSRDKKGIFYIIKLSSAILLIISIVILLILEIFSKTFMNMYSVTDPKTLSVSIYAIRVFAIMFVLTWIVGMYGKIALIMEKKLYSFLINIIDGFVFVSLFAYLLCRFVDVNGFWWAFPSSALVMIGLILLINFIILSRNKDKYDSIFLIPKNENILADISIDNIEKIPEIVKYVERICRENGVSVSRAMVASIAIEEMITIVDSNKKEKDVSNLDILIQKGIDEIYVDFRSTGAPFNPIVQDDLDNFDSYTMLFKISKDVKYDYALGMNSTRIILEN